MRKLFRRFNRSEQIDSIEMDISRSEQGLSFQLIHTKDQQPAHLPLRLTAFQARQQQDLERLELLEELWLEEWLQQNGDVYLLPYRYMYYLTEQERLLLGLPEKITKLNLKVSHEGYVGSERFRIYLEKDTVTHKNIEKTGQQTGPVITLIDGTEILMDEEQFEYEKFIQDSPNPVDADLIYRYIAEVRHKAHQLNIPMNTFLERQEYLFVDQFDLDVAYEEGAIQLNPKYKSSDNIDPEIMDQLSSSAARYARTNNQEQVFVQEDVAENVKQLRDIGPIQGAKVPQFVENPESMLPDGIEWDSAAFSDRVKELGIKVYRAQPYVHAQEKNRGWFELDTGFSVVDETGEVVDQFQVDGMKEWVDKAREEGEEYIYWNDQWLKIPNDAESFIEATDQLTQNLSEAGEKQQVDISKLPYVLEIYENVNQLEYNQPILDVRREMHDSGVLDRIPPAVFQANLKPFQEDGFVWMKTLHYRRLGGLLADDMGLGKTVQVIAFLQYLHELQQLKPTLIIVPKSLIGNWQKEVYKFAPGLLESTYVHQGPNRIKDYEYIQKYNLVLTTYQTLVRDQLVMGQIDWQVIICDEVQAIKNSSTAAAHVVKALKSRFRIGMTGTPVENSLSELWSIMDYVQPGLLGSLKDFREEYIQPLEEDLSAGEKSNDVEKKLINRLSVVYKRRTKNKELEGQLPKKEQVTICTPMGDVQQKLYMEIIHRVHNKEQKALSAIQELKQLCSHPGMLNEAYINLPIEEVPKLQATINIIRKIQNQEEKVLIFTDYILMQKILRKHIRDEFEINPVIINGKVMTERRQVEVDRFNRQIGFDVMILSTRVGGTGFTITSANHVIHYTRWWNPAVENQATDRVYRIGQEKDVTVYYPIVEDGDNILPKGTVEQIIHTIIEEKKELAESVIVPSKRLEQNIEDEVLKQVQLN